MQEVMRCVKSAPLNMIQIPADAVITKAHLTISYSPAGIQHIGNMKIVAQRPSQQ